MRALAEFAMRGRAQATTVCVIAAALPLVHWIGSAMVGLVLLRKGLLEGTLVLLWTSLPLLAWYAVNDDSSPLLVLAGTFLLAWLLRETVSWELTLAGAVVVAVVAGLIFEVTSAEVLTLLVEWFIALQESVQQQVEPLAARQVLVGFFAMGQMVAMVLALILARWWQSTLYNPGGFRREFHGLRLSPALSGLIVLTMLGFFVLGDPALTRWVPLLTVPMMVAAIGFVHWVVAEKKLSGSWLASFYILLVFLLQLVYPILASVALMDSWLNLRARIGSDQTDDEVK